MVFTRRLFSIQALYHYRVTFILEFGSPASGCENPYSDMICVASATARQSRDTHIADQPSHFSTSAFISSARLFFIQSDSRNSTGGYVQPRLR